MTQEQLFNLSFGSTHQLIKYVRHLLDSNITLSVHPDVDVTKPTLFCANHFTRFETFLMPSFFYQKLNMKVRSLADAGLFQTKLKNYLESLGTVSTRDENRDNIIIGDLIRGKSSWIIYPEGQMHKNKKISLEGDHFVLHNDEESHKMFTGSAVLALKSELEKQAYRQAKQELDREAMEFFREKYSILPDEHTSYDPVQIIPVTISYFPIRTGKNLFTQMSSSMLVQQNEIFMEELEIEGNLLLKADMNIHLDAPISIEKYIHNARLALDIKGNSPSDHASIIDYSRHKLTSAFMDKVYKNTLINFDHLFALVIDNYPTDTLRLTHLRAVIFLCAKELIELKVHRTHPMMHRDFFKLLIDEPYEMFDSVLALALEQNVLTRESDGGYRIDHDVLDNEHTFTTVRLKNTLRVVLNEVAMFSDIKRLVLRILDRHYEEVGKSVFDILYAQDLKRYDYAYRRCYSMLASKPKEVGAPFTLCNPHFEAGMVISHGYKAAPKEMESLAYFVHSLGINVYVVRLDGHGTTPEDLKFSSYVHWIDSFNRGFAAMRLMSRKLYLCGFSAGGLLALIAAASKQHKIDGLICINTAIKFKDIRFNYLLPTVGLFSNLLSHINANIEYYHDTPENPDINYHEHHIRSIMELKKLVDHAQPLLKRITAKTLIIQGSNDPVINPEGADLIYDSIKSIQKEKIMIEADEHVIVTSSHKEEVFKAIENFLKNGATQ